jgi:hypothetical protein
LKIRILQDNNIIRVYHSPHEVVVRPNSKKVEIFESDIVMETFDLTDKKLTWLENIDTDCAEIVLDLQVKK